jgi:hypothetical protein
VLFFLVQDSVQDEAMAAKKNSAQKKGKLPYLTRAAQHVIDERAKRTFLSALLPQWVLREMGTNDYGIDYQLEVFEAQQPRALRTAIQLKGTTQLKIVNGAVHFALDTRALATYLDTEVLPVFLVVGDVDAGVAYFVFLQRYALVALSGKKWREQGTVTIALQPEDRVDDTARFREALAEAHRYIPLLRPGAIGAALAAEQQRLQSIDPRFLAAITVTPDGQHVTLSPREPVEITLSISPELDPEKMRAFVTGQKVAFAPGELRFEGMPLWEHLNASASELQIGKEYSCAVTFSFTARENAQAKLVNVPATIVRGMVLRLVASSRTDCLHSK